MQREEAKGYLVTLPRLLEPEEACHEANFYLVLLDLHLTRARSREPTLAVLWRRITFILQKGMSSLYASPILVRLSKTSINKRQKTCHTTYLRHQRRSHTKSISLKRMLLDGE